MTGSQVLRSRKRVNRMKPAARESCSGRVLREAPSCKPPMAGDASRERFHYRDSRS